MATEIELLMLYYGIGIGVIPLLFVVILFKGEYKRAFKRMIYGKKAMLVKMVLHNKQTDTVVAKYVGDNKFHMGKNDYPFNPEEMGIEGKTPSILIREDGTQIPITKGIDEKPPVTAQQYNDDILTAMMAGANSLIMKAIKLMKLLMFVIIILAVINLVFIFQIADKILK